MAQDYFERGYIIKGYIPAQDVRKGTDTPPPSFILQGQHSLIVLHDSDFADINPKMALVVPITSATAEKQKAEREGRTILPSYIPLLKADYPFLEHDSYVSTAQVCPVNREWLESYIDVIQPAKMFEIDIQVIQNVGIMETVTRMAEHIYNVRLEEIAGGSEFKNGLKPDSENSA